MTEPTKTLRDGDLVERGYGDRAVKHHNHHMECGQRYLCLAYPCPNLADWFYLPANSDLCTSCVERYERERSE